MQPLGKHRRPLLINSGTSSAAGEIIEAVTANEAAPALTTPPPPTLESISTGLETGNRSATAFINITWLPAVGTQPQEYAIRWSTTSDFSSPDTAGVVQQAPLGGADPSRSIAPLKTNTTYYVQVASRYRSRQSAWSNTLSILTAKDDTPPSLPSSTTLTFDTGANLIINGVNPPEANFERLEITIKGSGTGPSYAVLSAAGAPGSPFRVVWPAAENVRTSGGDGTITVDIRSQNASGFFTNTTLTLSATKSTPTTPTIATDFSSRDLVTTITASADTARLTVAIDGGAARDIGLVSRWVYTYAQNAVDHGGGDTAAELADMASLNYVFTAYDALGQASTAATGTATNTAPVAPTVTLQSGWQLILGRITSAAPPDFEAYEWAWERSINGGSTWTSVRTEEGRTPAQELENTTDGSVQYRAKVRLKDAFGQYSAQTTSSVVTVDGFSMSAYRARAKYTDSVNNTETTLAALNDDNKASGGVTYALLASGWRWTQLERSFIERYMFVTIASTTANGYVGVSKDGTTWTWFSGPLGADGRTLVQVASETAAQSAAVALPVDSRFDLPAPVEARFVRLGHRNTSASYTIREFYPRTLVEGDDMRAETVKGYLIASRTVQADRIVAGSLTANEIAANAITATQIAANAVTAAKIAADAIDGKTITGSTIRSAAYGARWEGNSTRLFGSDGTNDQWEVTNADGSFRWGANAGRLSRNGMTMRLSTSVFPTFEPQAAIGWADTITGNPRAYIAGFDNSAQGTLEMRLVMANDTNKTATPGIRMIAHNTVSPAQGKLSLFPTELQVEVGDAYFSGNVRAANNIYLGVRAGWLSDFLNQMVKSTDSPTFSSVYANNWFRSNGSTGWYSETWGGGIYMIDGTWIRTYGGKNFYCDNTAKAATFISDGNGSFGSGTVPGTNRLYTKGATSDSTQNAFLAQNSGGANLMFLRNDGYSWVNQNWAVGSDLRLKENIVPLAADLYQALLRLRPVAYDYIAGAKAQYGFIAQEVQPLFPALVSQNDDGHLGITMSNFIPLLVGLLQQHEQRLRAIEVTE